MVFDRFDLIRIINLPERRDRRNQMMRELKSAGLAGDARVEFFSAIRPADAGIFSSVGAHGVYLSHLSILREAAKKNASVLILEDDCDFAPHVTTYDTDKPWDIFYGGYYAADPENLQTSDIIGAHMMGFTASVVGKVADYVSRIEPGIEYPPIDGFYVWFRRANPDVATVFAVPPIGNQRASRSDIASAKFFDRTPIVRDCVEVARRVRDIFRSRNSTYMGEMKW